MSRQQAQRRALQAVAGDQLLVPHGTAKAQVAESSTTLTIPGNLADHHDIEQSQDLKRYYHADTGCLVIPLDGDLDR